jgi:hypothetical protein
MDQLGTNLSDDTVTRSHAEDGSACSEAKTNYMLQKTFAQNARTTLTPAEQSVFDMFDRQHSTHSSTDTS